MGGGSSQEAHDTFSLLLSLVSYAHLQNLCLGLPTRRLIKSLRRIYHLHTPKVIRPDRSWNKTKNAVATHFYQKRIWRLLFSAILFD